MCETVENGIEKKNYFDDLFVAFVLCLLCLIYV